MMVKRFNLLDIIKGLMIIFIIITHFCFAYPDDYMKYGFYYWIDMAVPVFMIITGYLISMNINNNSNSYKQVYSIESLGSKFMRFLLPFIPVAIAEIPFLYFYKHNGALVIAKFIIGGGTDQDLIILR